MAILYGTTGDGTTLPVLVDQFGNLLAKGIEGQPGQPGEPGPPGGDFPLPPNPYEGAFLGWLNNDLAWIGTPPVPIPEGRFGPITGWDSGGFLTVEGEIPPQVAQGVFVYQCNEDGSIYVDGWNNSEVWSDSASGPFADGSPANAYDGKAVYNESPVINAGADVVIFEGVCPVTSNVDVFTWFTGNGLANITIHGSGNSGNPLVTLYNDLFEASADWHPIAYSGSVTKITMNVAANQTRFCGLKMDNVNGEMLVDGGEYPTAPNLNFRVQSVNGQNLIGVANRTDNFTIGKYLRIPEQNVARWLYDGNLDKVITSTDIDNSRLKEI
jgi:hypothetical protein